MYSSPEVFVIQVNIGIHAKNEQTKYPEITKHLTNFASMLGRVVVGRQTLQKYLLNFCPVFVLPIHCLTITDYGLCTTVTKSYFNLNCYHDMLPYQIDNFMAI